MRQVHKSKYVARCFGQVSLHANEANIDREERHDVLIPRTKGETEDELASGRLLVIDQSS